VSTDIGHRDLAGSIAGFVDDVVMPVAPAMARGDGPSPRRIVEAAGEAGLAGILTPEALGGAGGSHGDFIRFIEAVARADASCAVILDVHLSVGTEPLLVFGNDDQKSRYLPKLAAGEWLAAFALTEAAGGSDAIAMRTRAVRDGDTYVLDGAKAFITGAGDADLYIVMARTGEGARGVSAFLVEAALPGVGTGAPLAKMGLHGSWTGELVLDAVRVPAENRLGDEGAGFTVAMSALDSGRVGISAQAVGIAQGALDAALESARRRRDAGSEPDVTTIADMEVRTAAARQLTAMRPHSSTQGSASRSMRQSPSCTPPTRASPWRSPPWTSAHRNRRSTATPQRCASATPRHARSTREPTRSSASSSRGIFSVTDPNDPPPAAW